MNEEVIVSFPGLGIGEITMNKVAFSIGSLEVRWYGIILTLGIVAGFCYAMYRGKFEGISREDVMDFTLWTVLLAIVGARTYYVLTSLKTIGYHSFYDVIAIWEGGIAIYGAIIGGALGILLVGRFKKYDKTRILKFTDLTAPGVMLGQIIGRWGNFVNGETHGIETSENFFLRMGLTGWGADSEYPNRMTFYHPTFLYESLWNLLGFILINLLYKKKKFDGQILLMYLAWYGFGRMFIEGLRTDSLYVGVFRISQVVGFLCFAICTPLLIYFLVRKKREGKDNEEYTSVYEKSRGFGFTHKQAAAAESAAPVKWDSDTPEGSDTPAGIPEDSDTPTDIPDDTDEPADDEQKE